MINVFLIHGIADRDPSWEYNDFVNSVRQYMPIGAQVNWIPISWSHLLEDKESDIYESQKPYHFYNKLLHFTCDFCCDVLAYAPKVRPMVPGDFWFDLDCLISKAYDQANQDYPNSINIIIGHSLGTQVGLGFCFDRKIDHLITFGAPIVYFSVRFFKPEFPPNVKSWINLYSRYDPVATVISKMNQYEIVEDIEVSGWNPINYLPIKAHCEYWENTKVHKLIANKLQSIIDDKNKPII